MPISSPIWFHPVKPSKIIVCVRCPMESFNLPQAALDRQQKSLANPPRSVGSGAPPAGIHRSAFTCEGKSAGHRKHARRKSRSHCPKTFYRNFRRRLARSHHQPDLSRVKKIKTGIRSAWSFDVIIFRKPSPNCDVSAAAASSSRRSHIFLKKSRRATKPCSTALRKDDHAQTIRPTNCQSRPSSNARRPMNFPSANVCWIASTELFGERFTAEEAVDAHFERRADERRLRASKVDETPRFNRPFDTLRTTPSTCSRFQSFDSIRA